MGNFNKVLSFILGLVVVIVFVIVLSKRLNLQSKFIPFGNKTSPTPTITKLSDKGLEKPTDKTKDTPEIKFTQPEEQEDTKKHKKPLNRYNLSLKQAQAKHFSTYILRLGLLESFFEDLKSNRS